MWIGPMPAEDIKMCNISSASNLRGEFGVDLSEFSDYVKDIASGLCETIKNQHAAGKRTESFHFIESGEYNTTFELYKMFVKLGYRVKIQFNPNNTIEEILVISW